jgi:hypothetical protein
MRESDEAEEVWPEIPRVGVSPAFACGGVGLAGAGAGPDLAVLWPVGETERERPAADSGKEVDMGKIFDIG